MVYEKQIEKIKEEIGFYLLLEGLSNWDITKRKTIYNMKLYEILDYLLIKGQQDKINDLSRSTKDGATYF